MNGRALLAHMIGDYCVQTSYMAARKTTDPVVAAAHAITYTACFLPITRSARALAVIGGSHYLIDRYRLARHLNWLKNQAAPAAYRYRWADAQPTGYDNTTTPIWLSTWLMIIADNTVHVAINAVALERLA